MADRFTLNVNREVDTIHREHPFEACNTDDAEDLQYIDELTATQMIAHEQAVECQHCKPFTAE